MADDYTPRHQRYIDGDGAYITTINGRSPHTGFEEVFVFSAADLAAHDADVTKAAREQAAKDIEAIRDAIVEYARIAGVPFNAVQCAAFSNAANEVRNPSPILRKNGETND